MDANAREAVLNSIVEHFYAKAMDHTFPPDDAELPDALKRQVGYFFKDMEGRFNRLEHPEEALW